MASNGSDKGGLLTAGGVLSIVAGIFQLSNGVGLATYLLTDDRIPYWELPQFIPSLVGDWWVDLMPIYFREYFPICLIIVGGLLLGLGILAVVGGISAVRRKRFGLSLAGAICALPSGLLGILAVVLVALGKREFGAKV